MTRYYFYSLFFLHNHFLAFIHSSYLFIILNLFFLLMIFLNTLQLFLKKIIYFQTANKYYQIKLYLYKTSLQRKGKTAYFIFIDAE